MVPRAVSPLEEAMKVFVCAVCILASAIAGGISRAQATAGNDDLAGYAALFQESPSAQATAPPLTLDDVEQVALARSPEIAVAARRVAVAEAHVPVAGALDDPMAMYRGWQVPLRQPWNFNDAQNMFSISQTFSGAGNGRCGLASPVRMWTWPRRSLTRRDWMFGYACTKPSTTYCWPKTRWRFTIST
jgi:hypothetical protein